MLLGPCQTGQPGTGTVRTERAIMEHLPQTKWQNRQDF